MAGEAQETNVGTADIQEPVVKAGGETMTNFDDLESVENFAERSAQVDESLKRGKDEPKSDEASSDEGTDGKGVQEDGGEGKSAEKHGDSDSSDESEAADEKDQVAEAEKPDKIYKVKQGEDEVEVYSNTEFDVTVKGEAEKVSLQELLNNYSGKTVWNKKFTELDRQQKEFEANRRVLNSTVTELHKRLNDGDAKGAITVISELFGANPFDVLRSFEKQLKVVDDDGLELTDQEIEAQRLRDENEYWKNRREREAEDAKIATKRQEIESKVDEIKDQYGVDDKQLVEAFDSIVAGGVEKSKVTIENIGEYFFLKEKVALVEDTMRTVAPDMPKEEFDQSVYEVAAKIRDDRSLTDEEIVEAVKEVYGNSAEQKLSDKLRKGSEIKTPDNKPIDPRNEAMFFDELDE